MVHLHGVAQFVQQDIIYQFVAEQYKVYAQTDVAFAAAASPTAVAVAYRAITVFETMLLGICNKQNFMDLFENFILFDHSGGKCAKIFARNHQYLGVNEAVESYKARKLKNGRLGVFWHTQGSGKSYSMLFLSQKIRRKFPGSPTIVVLTDRNDLDNQLFEQYWEAKANYELQYGPMNNFGHCPATYPWSWINDPWPWERGGNV